jgi:small basic protein
MKQRFDRLIQALVFIRLGQQLGTDSDLAQAVAHGIDLIVSTLSRFLA